MLIGCGYFISEILPLWNKDDCNLACALLAKVLFYFWVYDIGMLSRWNELPLHFKINKYHTYQNPHTYSKVQFAFERESFDSIASLMTHHVGRRIPISLHTGAIISTPINRDLPLSYSDVCYASLKRKKPVNEGNSVLVKSSVMIDDSSTSQHSGGFVLMHGLQSLTTPSNRTAKTFDSPQPFPLQLPENGNEVASFSNEIKQANDVQPKTTQQPKTAINTNNDDSGDELGPLYFVKQKSTIDVPPKPSRVPSFRRPVIRHTAKSVSQKKSAQNEENRLR